MDKITDQLILEIKKRSEELNFVDFGEIFFRIQNGKVVHWDVKKTFKVGADPKNGRSKA